MNYQIATRVSYSTPPAVAQINEMVHKFEAEDTDLVYLLRGEPDFDTPPHICQAATESLQRGETHYPPVRGLLELRQAVADRMERDFNLLFNPPEEIIVTSGATMGIFIALQAVINPGDEVILFDPIYDPYPTIVRMAGGVPVQVSAEEENGHFTVSPEALSHAITRRTKAILINNPWNPTGSVMTYNELNKLVDLAVTHDLILISDEIYEYIVFGGRRHVCVASISPQARNQSIVINSFSKTYAMTGWRLGYNIAPSHLTNAMLKIAQQFSRSATSFVQRSGVAALNGVQEPILHMVNSYAQRRDLVTKILGRLDNFSFHPPEGTFFFFLDIRKFGMDSKKTAEYLLQRARVVTIPGNVYGPAGEGYIRLSFAYDDITLQNGISAIVDALKKI